MIRTEEAAEGGRSERSREGSVGYKEQRVGQHLDDTRALWLEQLDDCGETGGVLLWGESTWVS